MTPSPRPEDQARRPARGASAGARRASCATRRDGHRASSTARSSYATHARRSTAFFAWARPISTCRESELAEQIREAAFREERLRAGEATLAQRTSELGAVELKREAVERRERALAEREARIAAREAELADRPSLRYDVELVFVPGIFYRLVAIDPTPLVPGEALRARRRSVRRGANRPVATPDRQPPLRLPGARSARRVVGRKLVGKLD